MWSPGLGSRRHRCCTLPAFTGNVAAVTIATSSTHAPVCATLPLALPTPHVSIGRIPVLEVSPVIEGGRWPAKAAVGEVVPIEATVFREGHDAVAATAVLIAPDGGVAHSVTMTSRDAWSGVHRGLVQPTSAGEWSFRVEAWSDPYATWLHDAVIKFDAGMDQELMIAEGAALFARITAPDQQAQRSPQDAAYLTDVARTLINPGVPLKARLDAASSQATQNALARWPLRDLVTASATYPLRVSRRKALYGSWYEIFPRSLGAYQDDNGSWHSGTFATAAHRLPAIAAMGFDVLYLTPIHPIGSQYKKGKNNTLDSLPTDPGSPYAIGSADGGHDAIHPDLGTVDDFTDFTALAKELGMEVALDIALQCSPDHPWVTEHPQWFKTRADGSVAYAENPPKKYQDIYPLYFDNDPIGLRKEILRIILLWIKRGVTLFRVDNPHTKALDFWEWLLAQVHARHPEVIFLSEAFTKPAMMATLARIGYHQSYTYFTWRNHKQEIVDYLQEVSGPAGSVMRPSFWPTTHDILPPYLQKGGVAAHAVRAVLAATGSPTWGIYNGYELVENVPRPGVEEHIDNEKYEFKPRDWAQADKYGIALLLGRLNEIRAAHPALQQLRNLTIHPCDNDNIIVFSKRIRAQHMPLAMDPLAAPIDDAANPVDQASPDRDDVILVVINLDPSGVQDTSIDLNLDALGLQPPVGHDGHSPFIHAHDLITGYRWEWSARPYVRLDPRFEVAHVMTVTSR